MPTRQIKPATVSGPTPLAPPDDHPSFDFEAAEEMRPLMDHWRRLEAAAREEMSEENLCLAWVTESDGRAWVDWWKELPAYKRASMLSSYQFERQRMDDLMEAWKRNHPDLPRPYMRMAPYTEPSREEIEQEQAIIDSMVWQPRPRLWG